MQKHIAIFCLLFFCLSNTHSRGQTGLTKGQSLPDLQIKTLLNAHSSITYLDNLPGKITLLDFFGTWCSPCLRALPHLTNLQEQFKNNINVVLVSNETEAQLSKFIAARKSFSFPVIVDESNQWNNLFQPPSLPYTVVVKQGTVIDITTAESITGDDINNWLKDVVAKNTMPTNESKSNTSMDVNRKSSNGVVQLSQSFIYAAKTGEPIEAIAAQLKNLDYPTLVKALQSDNDKKAFWINLYNGYTQAVLKSNPDEYKNRNAFYKKKQVNVAGKLFSLDEIEHGILRHSKIKWSLGYVNKLFPSETEKELRVKNVDYRIHFALNCGAKSCPPIAFYNPATLDKQLDVATNAYLTGEASYNNNTNVLQLPALMSWFRADFGGKKGMVALVKKLHIVPENAHPKITFKKYDWSLSLNNYKTNE